MRYVATGVHEKEEREREKGKLEPSVLGWYYGTTGENVRVGGRFGEGRRRGGCRSRAAEEGARG